MSQKEQYYDFQPSFNSGEISPDVANRTDLDKFRSALLKARNCFVKPYGAVYRRPGTRFVAETKYPGKKCILHEFDYNATISYLLEIGVGYIRVYKDNTYMNVEVATPFTEEDLDNLRFAQSADTLFIASGTHNVQLLQRYTDVDWRLSEMDLSSPYFDVANGSEGLNGNVPVYNPSIKLNLMFSTQGSFIFTAPATGTYTIVIAGSGGAGISVSHGGDGWGQWLANGGSAEIKTVTMRLTAGTVYRGVVGSRPNNLWYEGDYNRNAPDGGTSSFNGQSARGGGGANYHTDYREGGPTGYTNNGTNYGSGPAGGSFKWHDKGVVDSETQPKGGYVNISCDIKGDNNYRADGLWPSGVTGNITLNSSTRLFRAGLVGSCVKLYHNMPSQTVTIESTGSATSAAVLAGKAWKCVTHGKWGGTITLEASTDGQTWRQYRVYTSKYADNNGDFNASETGTVDEYTYIRVKTAITGGTVTVDLTRMTYTHEGYAQITKYVSDTQAQAKVIKQFGSTEKTALYSMSCWCPEYGYPRCVGFFQDRLILASNKLYPYAVWMSRTGDYYNFSVEKADGKVTDDSAIMLSLVNRKEYAIQHIVAFTDLFIFTDGNEWIISGSSTVTPTAASPRVQSARGCEGAEPILVGGRIVYIQRRGTSVRDFAYSYDTDNYDGADLSILAKHLTENRQMVDGAYQQDPNSMLYFITSDGKINMLTYVANQKVYAWSSVDSNGKFESVVNLVSGYRDTVYVVVSRELNGNTKRFIEYFSDYPDTEDWMEYSMLDCSEQWRSELRSSSIAGLERFAGGKVDVLADGEYYKDISVDGNGGIVLPKEVSKATIGLRYTSEIETPNLEVNGQTVQGKYKKVSEAILRLTRSQGGEIGNSSSFVDPIVYPEDGLYSGDLETVVPNQPTGGYEKLGRVYIKLDEPYPFELSGVIRVVSFGG